MEQRWEQGDVEPVLVLSLPVDATTLIRIAAAGVSGMTFEERPLPGPIEESSEAASPGPRELRFVLSPRELDIARLAAAGLSNRQIAQQTRTAPGTVKSHLNRVFAKLGVQNRVQLALRVLDPSKDRRAPRA